MSRHRTTVTCRIGLHDSDKTGFPNLALMKLSQYYKADVFYKLIDGEFVEVK